MSEKSLELEKYNTWLNEISPSPHIIITDGRIDFADTYSNIEGKEIISKKGTISAKITNSEEGSANNPKWAWRINLKDGIRKPYKGRWRETKITKDELANIGYDTMTYPYLEEKSRPYVIVDSEFELDNINERGYIDTLEIWVSYCGKKNIEYRSYMVYRFINGSWIIKKPNKVYRVKYVLSKSGKKIKRFKTV